MAAFAVAHPASADRSLETHLARTIEVQIEPILRLLAGPPEFVLPPASTGHTRHFVPWFKKGPDDRTLVFDTFVAVSRVRRWSSVGRPRRSTISSATCSRASLTTLILSADPSRGARRSLWTTTKSHRATAVRCRAIRLPATRSCDCSARIRRAPLLTIASLPSRRKPGRGTKKTSIGATRLYDPAWNLCMETLQLHRERWSDPPGSHWFPMFVRVIASSRTRCGARAPATNHPGRPLRT